MSEFLFESKTQRKHTMHAIQNMAIALADYPQEVWHELTLDEKLCQALLEYRRLSRQAKKRQGKYLGKLLRMQKGEDVIHRIEQFFTKKNNAERRKAIVSAKIPYIFSQLLRGEMQCDQVKNILPNIDIYELQSMIINAQKTLQNEQKNNKNIITPVGKAQKKLWKYLLANLSVTCSPKIV